MRRILASTFVTIGISNPVAAEDFLDVQCHVVVDATTEVLAGKSPLSSDAKDYGSEMVGLWQDVGSIFYAEHADPTDAMGQAYGALCQKYPDASGADILARVMTRQLD